MRAKVKLMSMDLMDRLFQHPGESPEMQAIRNEDTLENRQAEQQADLARARQEQITQLLDREFALLEARKRSGLAVYLVEHQKFARDWVADRLEVKRGTLRTAIFRARGKQRSEDTRSACEAEQRSMHTPGKDLWDAIAMKVAMRLRRRYINHE
jgi:hypothetical protein